MPLKGAGDGSNKAQKAVVNKKGKKGPTDVDEDDIAFKKKQQEEKKAAQAYLDKGKKK